MKILGLEVWNAKSCSHGKIVGEVIVEEGGKLSRVL